MRYHRRGNPRLGDYATLAEPGDRKRLVQLSTFLRLAESLERARAGRILDLRVTVKKKKVQVTLLASEEPTIELWETRKHEGLFRRAFDRKLEIAAEVDARRRRRVAGFGDESRGAR